MTTPNAKPFAKCLTLATLLTALFASTGALAHTDDYLDTQKHANGGQMRMAGALHFELVVAKDNKAAKESPLIVYVTDHADARRNRYGDTAVWQRQKHHHADARWRQPTQGHWQIRVSARPESHCFD